MKSLLILSTLFVSSLAFAGPMLELKTEDDLTAYINKTRFNGVALLAKGNKILYKKAFGYKNLETKIPNTVNDKFFIGSVTKQFVAAALLKLQDEGALSIDDKVTKYLPQYKELEKISIRDLLNHTSGIANYSDQKEFWPLMSHDKVFDLDELIQFTLSYPFDFEVTTNWKYSNSGYIVAGKILEVASGKAWDQAIKDSFLNPMGMKDTGHATFQENITDVVGHVLNEKGELVSMYKVFNQSWALSAGSFYSTVDDLLKWTEIYTTSPLLSKASKKEMQTPFRSDYGLGLQVLKYPEGETFLYHNGRVPGFSTSLAAFVKSQYKVVTFDNTDASYSKNTPDVLISFFAEGSATVLRPETFELPLEQMKEYVGDFIGKDIKVKVFIADAKLFLQPNGQRPYLLRANDVDSFNLEDFAGEEFIRNAKGEIIKLKHYQGGVTELTKVSSVK